MHPKKIYLQKNFKYFQVLFGLLLNNPQMRRPRVIQCTCNTPIRVYYKTFGLHNIFKRVLQGYNMALTNLDYFILVQTIGGVLFKLTRKAIPCLG